MSSNSHTHVKKLDVAAHTCSPSFGGQRLRILKAHRSARAAETVSFQLHLRPCLKAIGRRVKEKPQVLFWPLHACRRLCTPTCSRTHTQFRKSSMEDSIDLLRSPQSHCPVIEIDRWRPGLLGDASGLMYTACKLPACSKPACSMAGKHFATV